MANDPTDKIQPIRGMRFPPAFVDLWTAGKWRQPDEALIRSLIPWLQGPIEFLETMGLLVTENSGELADHLESSEITREYRGSASSANPDLPWLDVDQALIIAANRILGDDLAIAMDFRTSTDDPRVVASYWCGSGRDYHTEWRAVTGTLSEFLTRLEMVDSTKDAT